MMDEEIRQALCEVREMKKMCGNINMKLANIVTQRGQDWKKKLEAEYQRGLEEGREQMPCDTCAYRHNNLLCADCKWTYGSRYKVDSIGVGDEVEWTGDKYIVTYINYNIDTSEITDYDLLGEDGSVADHVKKCAFVKTGRHFDIAKILEAMKHD